MNVLDLTEFVKNSVITVLLLGSVSQLNSSELDQKVYNADEFAQRISNCFEESIPSIPYVLVNIIRSYFFVYWKCFKSWDISIKPIDGVAFNVAKDEEDFDRGDNLTAIASDKNILLCRGEKVERSYELPDKHGCHRNAISMVNSVITLLVRNETNDDVSWYETNRSVMVRSARQLMDEGYPFNKFNRWSPFNWLPDSTLAYIAEQSSVCYMGSVRRAAYYDVRSKCFEQDISYIALKSLFYLAAVGLSRDKGCLGFVNGDELEGIIEIIDVGQQKKLVEFDYGDKEKDPWKPTQIALSSAENSLPTIALLSSSTGELRLYNNLDFTTYATLRLRWNKYIEGVSFVHQNYSYNSCNNHTQLMFSSCGRYLIEQREKNDFTSESNITIWDARKAQLLQTINVGAAVRVFCMSKNDSILIGDDKGKVHLYKKD